MLQNKLFKIELANESHLDTIETMKSELIHLKDLTKIELSGRQNEVLGNLAFYGASKSYPEIASLMNISLDGFQTHIYQIKKLLSISGTAGKQQLIFYAKENNLIEFATKRDNA